MPCRECSNFDKIQCSLYQVGEIGEQNEQKYLLPRFSHAAPVGVGPSVFSYFLDYASPFCVAFIESHTTSFDLSPREFATCMRAHIPFSSSAGIRQYGSRLEQPALPVTDWNSVHCFGSFCSALHDLPFTRRTSPQILALEHDLRKAEEAIERESGIRMVIWTPQCKTPPETHLLHFDYSYWVLSRVYRLVTLLVVLRHYEHSLFWLPRPLACAKPVRDWWLHAVYEPGSTSRGITHLALSLRIKQRRERKRERDRATSMSKISMMASHKCSLSMLRSLSIVTTRWREREREKGGGGGEGNEGERERQTERERETSFTTNLHYGIAQMLTQNCTKSAVFLLCAHHQSWPQWRTTEGEERNRKKERPFSSNLHDNMA